MAPSKMMDMLRKNIKKEWKLAFVSTMIWGLLVHIPIMTSDIPNHDGLASIYFNQNMITSGRWFLGVACGISSFFTLPWLIGVLALIYIGLTVAVLVEIFEFKNSLSIVLMSGLVVAFPSVASTFAYVFTMDGYMMGLLFATLAVLLTKKYKKGFIFGAVFLGFSLGIYQAYLPFAILLSMYCVAMEFIKRKEVVASFVISLRYLGMGVLGATIYYIILQILLKLQGKTLDTYQGINNLDAVDVKTNSLLATIVKMYSDFLAFTIKGNVLANNILTKLCIALILIAVIAYLTINIIQKRWWRNLLLLSIIVGMVILIPIATNIIFVVSKDVTYHLLMRYQWVLFLVLALKLSEQAEEMEKLSIIPFAITICLSILIINYVVTDNIAYSNLEKKYEKTYAYTLRLVDRIEQTEGYYQGIPIALVGVVSDEQYPQTYNTAKVTDQMIGISGDMLVYTASNYEAFMRNYLGVTFNFVDEQTIQDIYYTDEYMAMDSFPGENSTHVYDGILYVKTENSAR